MIYLHKMLPLFFLPLAWVSYLCLFSLLSQRKAPLLIALVLLWLSSMPYTSDALVRWVENGATKSPVSEVPKAQYIVVLSGMIHAVKASAGPHDQSLGAVEWSDPDRFFSGLELYKAQSASHSVKLIFTGSVIPWWPQSPSEGHYLAEKAQEMGVPQSQILITPDVNDTAQEALAVKDLIDKDSRDPSSERLVLVTSAFHMPRAKALFEKAGLEVTPYPVDFKVKLKDTTPMDFLPDAQALWHTQTGVRELMGRAFYALTPLGEWLR